MRTKRNDGFTLVEILIVVVILGILAAIVIPQFSNASKEANESNMVSNLQTLRSQIALYKIKNNDAMPDTTTDANFTAAMVPTFLQSIPTNPLNGLSTISRGATNPGDDATGWFHDTDDDTVWANSAGTSIDGTAYTAL